MQVDARKGSFDASFSPVINDAPIKQQGAKNWYLASTPCSSKRVNLPKKSYAKSKDVDLRKQIFEKEIISKSGKSLSEKIDLSNVEEHDLAKEIKTLSIVNSSPILVDSDSSQGELQDKSCYAQLSSVSNNVGEGNSQLVESHLTLSPKRHHMASHSVCNSRSHLSFLVSVYDGFLA